MSAYHGDLFASSPPNRTALHRTICTRHQIICPHLGEWLHLVSTKRPIHHQLIAASESSSPRIVPLRKDPPSGVHTKAPTSNLPFLQRFRRLASFIGRKLRRNSSPYASRLPLAQPFSPSLFIPSALKRRRTKEGGTAFRHRPRFTYSRDL